MDATALPDWMQQALQPLVDWAAANPAAALGAAAALPAVLLFVVGLRLLRHRPAKAPAALEAPPAAAEPAAPRALEPAPERESPAAPPRAAAPAEAPVASVEVRPPVPAAAPAPARAAAPAPAAEPARPAPPPPAAPRPLRERLARTREALLGGLGRVLGTRRVDESLLEELEALLFSADLGVRSAEALLDAVRKNASGGDAEAVRRVLREAILERLRRVEPAEPPPGLGGRALDVRPHVILVLGVNGSGKTTTIGKLAALYRAAGHAVVLGAGDTFRAAAIEQLQVWGERTGCPVIAGKPGGDPAAVAFDAVQAARARGADVAIVDTAGRLQTKAPLMEELGKIARAVAKGLPGAPHETLLVLDANTGQNALSQARLFTEVAPVSALALTKLDGTAKGGVLVGLAEELAVPVRWVGVGEGVEDLRAFSAPDFVDALFAD
jgi:fused signal recognition particle receptor